MNSLLKKFIEGGWLGLGVLCLTGLFFATLPIWHGPDEQVHFSQLAFRAEKGRQALSREKDVTYEIFMTTELLGTRRDTRGNNSFTFNPGYRMEFNDDIYGPYEHEIERLKDDPLRKVMVGADASDYPPVYYLVCSWMYRMFYDSSIITRVFAARVVTVFLYLALVWVSFQVGLEVFKEKFLAQVLALMVGFHPMVKFVGVSVSSDTAWTLTFSVFLWGCIILLRNLRSRKGLLLVACAFLAGPWVKPQWYLMLPVLFMLGVFNLFPLWWKLAVRTKLLSGVSSVALVLVTIFILRVNLWWTQFIPEFPDNLGENQYGVWEHIKYVRFHTYREVLPWYWGVFNWLGVTLPRWTNRVQMSILLITSLSLGWWFVATLRKRSISRQELAILFLSLAAGVYFVGIETWEYVFILGKGYAYGIQGRYFFPGIIGHMIAILWAFWRIGGKRLVAALGIWWIILGWVGWKTIAGSYYVLWPLTSFLTQASQYKPAPLKSWGLEGLLFAAIVSSLGLAIAVVRRGFFSTKTRTS